ncbi:MAG: proline dehydrogenase family protein [Candidatus Thiodiazotropha sp. (ex Monitilora ramsayi)]|nr:proline dehydrogenase family protein [Candidatus Thiodiazotropha sp. (ex Monitilora ramsayi)]
MLDRQERILIHGKRLLGLASNSHLHSSLISGWIRNFLERLNQYEDFRIRALRFIDVLPTLDNDSDIVELFNEYFTEGEFPMPALGKITIQSGRLISNRLFAKSIKQAVSLLASQYMTSNDLQKITSTISDLQSIGNRVSLDLLGEMTLSNVEAEQYQSTYIKLLDSLSSQAHTGLQCSIKLSSLCPHIDVLNLSDNHKVILNRIRPILLKARENDINITLDMEDYERKPITMEIFKSVLFDETFLEWEGFGIALQGYLKTAESDLKCIIDLARSRVSPFHVRWVRGAYWDQEMVIAKQYQWESPVWQTQSDTDIAYERGLEALLSDKHNIQVAVATHNPRSLALTMAIMEEKATQKHVEFQMLYGMAEHYQNALIEMGYPLRIYLPFGELIPGMAYLVRRLLENASSQSIDRLQQSHLSSSELFQVPQRVVNREIKNSSGFVNCATRRFIDMNEQQHFQRAIDNTRDLLDQDYPLFIDGGPIETRDKIISTCPSNTGIRVGRTAHAGTSEADIAVKAALKSLNDWQNTSISDRADLLRKTAIQISEQRDNFSALEIFEAGKNWREADADVCEAIDFLNYYADQAEELFTERQVNVPGEVNLHRYQSRGISLIIPPWNFPLAILTGLLSASLVSGNCALLKPASDTPVIAAHLVKLMHKVGFPAGVINYLPGTGSKVGEYLVRHPEINLIAFTGSLDVGKRIQRYTSDINENQHHFKKVIAEMGGKNAIIVDNSADPDEAISGIIKSAFGYQGQKCSACSRVIVVKSQYEKFCKRLAGAVDSLIVADPVLPQSQIGPVISKSAKERILKTIEMGKQWGKMYYQTEITSFTEGHYAPPTLFKDVQPDSPLAQDEIFGPVISLIPANDLNQALMIANSTRYALTGGIYSRSPAHLEYAKKAFRVGNLYLNRGITGALVNRQPFGGHQMSGIGYKAGGKDYLMQFVVAKCITENTMRRGVAPLS